MWRRLTWACLGTLTAAFGCVSGPPVGDPPTAKGSDSCPAIENPIYLPYGPWSYARVFDKLQDILGEYFDIRYDQGRSPRYDGIIDTYPRIAPGYEQIWKPGTPDPYERLLATFQTIRHHAVVRINAANDGGFFVDVKVYKELEDIPKPTSATAGAASFRSDNPLERQFEVVEPTRLEGNWIPIDRKGNTMRDYQFEQLILRRLKKCM